MPIHRLLQHLAFDPDDVQILVSAYESCRKALKLDTSDPKNEALARIVVEIAQTGIRDARRIRKLALEQMGS